MRELRTPPKLGERADWLHSLRESASVSDKSWTLAFALSLLIGYLGADRFYRGQLLLGFLKLATFGGLSFWYIADVILLLVLPAKDWEGKIIKKPF